MINTQLKSVHKRPVWLTPEVNEQNSGHFHYRVGGRTHKWRPPTDVYETEDEIIVRVEIAGMRDSEFSISLNDRVLTIEGARIDHGERRAFHQMEIPFGEFSTEVILHWAVESDAVEAEYNDGILRLVLPKTKPYQIKIGK